MSLIEPITVERMKKHLRVLDDSDQDEVIGDYISSARARVEAMTGLTLTYPEDGDAIEVDPTLLQGIRLLVGGYWMDRDGGDHTEKAECAVQNLIFNARLMINELPSEA